MLTNISFPPITNQDARIVILGSMPGTNSLQQQQYYAHPRNAFWSIMTELFNMKSDWDYQQRCKHLIENNIAVWDVLKSCQRQGSLDQHIDTDSMIVNDFNTFFQQQPHIKKIIFNGTKTEQIFNRQVVPTLNSSISQLAQQRLPSTSPAHASMKFDQKLQLWRQALQME